MKQLRVYLACPFSVVGKHSNSWEELRFKCANIAAMVLINTGFQVFSPLSHSDPIAAVNPASRNTHALWLGQDEAFLEWCDVVMVLDLPGHADSYGVMWEIQWAHKNGKIVYHITMDDIYEMEEEGKFNEEIWNKLEG